ncbi:MAG TPA: HAD-IB family hydrolase [Polyangiaceae bacterium]
MTDRYIVFADVDDTLIAHKSMVGFMDYLLERDPFAAEPAAEPMRQERHAIQEARSRAADRAALHRRYYRLFEGLTRGEVRRAAHGWLREVTDRGELFVRAAYQEILDHKADGAELVLVSGSFLEVLAPIGIAVGADGLLCTELATANGVCTGATGEPLVGEGKWEAIRRYLHGRDDVRMEDCYAYGDHVTDVCFMEKVGHAVVVGTCPVLREIAERRNWRVLTEEHA